MLLIALFSLVASGSENPAMVSTTSVPTFSSPATMTLKQESPVFEKKAGASVYYLTSRTTQTSSMQTMRNASDGGGGSDGPGAALPNLNYLSLQGYVPVSQRQSVSLLGLQSLDSPAQRKVSTPFGVDFQLPSQVAMLRYRYDLTDRWSTNVSSVYIENLGVRDPMIGAGYVAPAPGGWLQNYSLATSAPVTSTSKQDGVITRSIVRSIFVRRTSGWAVLAALSHLQTFFNGDGPRRASPGPQVTQKSDDGKPLIPIFPSATDLVLIERERNRTRSDFSVNYSLTDRLEVGSGAGLSYAVTEKDHTLWMTTAKPLMVKYQIAKAEIGADVSLNSDIRDYASPRWPSILTVGLRAGYTFGQTPPPPF